MTAQGFNHENFTIKEMTGLSEIRVENLEPRKEKKRSSIISKKNKEKGPTRKGK